MKVGDLVKYRRWKKSVGIAVKFPPSTHPKEWSKVTVLTREGIENWVIQFCEVISEER